MKQTMIYVGLNDSVTHVQKFDTQKYMSVLKNVCRSYHAAFSVHTINGGYFHEDGSYVEETTLCLTLMDLPENTVREIAQDLCAFFHQESVMVSESEADVYFLKEDLG
ncbi:MAG: hypothetical protein K6C36_08415 [Clostridia bacterium]|nr:hypothetical protein [Clostridia bacterium]